MELTLGGGPPMLEGALCFMDPGPSFMAGTCGEAGEVGDLLSDVLGLDDRFRGWAPSSCKGKTATRLAWRDLFSTSPRRPRSQLWCPANQSNQAQAKGWWAGYDRDGARISAGLISMLDFWQYTPKISMHFVLTYTRVISCKGTCVKEHAYIGSCTHNATHSVPPKRKLHFKILRDKLHGILLIYAVI